MTTERRSEELPERWSAQRKTEVVLRGVAYQALVQVLVRIAEIHGDLDLIAGVDVLASKRMECTSEAGDRKPVRAASF